MMAYVVCTSINTKSARIRPLPFLSMGVIMWLGFTGRSRTAPEIELSAHLCSRVQDQRRVLSHLGARPLYNPRLTLPNESM